MDGEEITDLKSLYIRGVGVPALGDYGIFIPGRDLDFSYRTPSGEDKTLRTAHLYTLDYAKVDISEPIDNLHKYSQFSYAHLLSMTFGDEPYAATFKPQPGFERELKADGRANIQKIGNNQLASYLMFVEDIQWKMTVLFDENNQPLEVKFIKGDEVIPGEILPYLEGSRVGMRQVDDQARFVFSAVLDDHRVLIGWTQHGRGNFPTSSIVVAQKIISRDEKSTEDPLGSTITPESLLRLARENPNHPDLLFSNGQPFLFVAYISECV